MRFQEASIRVYVPDALERDRRTAPLDLKPPQSYLKNSGRALYQKSDRSLAAKKGVPAESLYNVSIYFSVKQK